MRIEFIISLAAVSVAIIVASLRWLRVAQREHYLAGSVTRFAWRWWQNLGRDQLALLAAVASLIFCQRYPLTALVVAVAILFLPEGLSLRGRTSKLHWTRRLKTVAVGLAVLIGVVAVAGSLLNGLTEALACMGFVAIWLPVFVDAVLFVFAPLEKKLGNKYVTSAKEKLSRVKPTIVAITGSYGKTSTKGYVAHLLSGRYQVLASPQSYNNQAGLTKTVNELLVPGTDVLVAEMGAYGKGEIAALCSWLPPKVSVITAIGPVHLERFKTLDRTLKAKSEITEGAEVVVLNIDDERLLVFATQLMGSGRNVIACSSTSIEADVALIAGENGVEVFVDHASVGHVQFADLGGVALTNVACAIGVAKALECTPTEIVERLSSLPVADHRLEGRPAASGAMILDDTFNSNPAGTKLALDRLVELSAEGGRRVVVTPGMVELGHLQFDENATFATRASEVATDLIIVGRTNLAALRSGVDPTSDVMVLEARDRDEAVSFVASEFGPGDVILYENDLPDHFP